MSDNKGVACGKYAVDLIGDHLILPDWIDGTDYLIQIHDTTGRVANEFVVFKGPGEVQWLYRQKNVNGWTEWRPYFMPEGRFRAVIIF